MIDEDPELLKFPSTTDCGAARQNVPKTIAVRSIAPERTTSAASVTVSSAN